MIKFKLNFLIYYIFLSFVLQKSAEASREVMTCNSLYSNGIVRPMSVGGEYCSVQMGKFGYR